jgi:hypothetical protein
MLQRRKPAPGATQLRVAVQLEVGYNQNRNARRAKNPALSRVKSDEEVEGGNS